MSAERPGIVTPRGQLWSRRLLVAIGIAMLAYAVFAGATSVSFSYLRFVVLVLVLGLLVALPAAMGVSDLIGRIIPVVARPVVQSACLASAVVVTIALPALLGYGRRSDLPSALPRNYLSGLLTVLALVWAIACVLTVARIVRRRTRREPRP